MARDCEGRHGGTGRAELSIQVQGGGRGVQGEDRARRAARSPAPFAALFPARPGSGKMRGPPRAVAARGRVAGVARRSGL